MAMKCDLFEALVAWRTEFGVHVVGPFNVEIPGLTAGLTLALARFAAVSRAYTVLAFLPVLAGIFPACAAGAAS